MREYKMTFKIQNNSFCEETELKTLRIFLNIYSGLNIRGRKNPLLHGHNNNRNI